MTAKGYCCYLEISRQITLEAKKRRIEQLFLEQPLLYSELLVVAGSLKQFKDASNESLEIVFIDRGIPDVLAYMHYSGDRHPAHLIWLTNNKLYIQNYSFYHLGKIYIVATKNATKTLNKQNLFTIIL